MAGSIIVSNPAILNKLNADCAVGSLGLFCNQITHQGEQGRAHQCSDQHVSSFTLEFDFSCCLVRSFCPP
jgi:hypothetical protein